MLKHFGRIALSSIVNRWSDTHPSNPRFLASEVAATIRSLEKLNSSINPQYASVYHSGQAGRDETISITYGALADYFDSASTGHPASTLNTSSGEFPVANVLIWQHWFQLITVETVHRMGNVETLVLPANGSVSVALSANDPAPSTSHARPSPPPSGSSPGYLKMYQTKLRKEGEQSAAEDLDAEKAARQHLEREVVELRAKIDYKDAQVTQLRDDAEVARRELSQALRQKQQDNDEIIDLEERLEDAMALAECLRADNPISPPEIRLAFECWRTITRDGTHNPAGAGGRGVHGLVEDWLNNNGYKLNKEATERLCAVVSWRKRGAGAIRSQ